MPFAEKKADTQIFGTLSAHFRIGNIHISSFFVLGRVRKRVELNYSNWPGLTLSSPIRFSSADRRTKSMICNAVPNCGSDRLKLHFREGSVADISQSEKQVPPENLEMYVKNEDYMLFRVVEVIA